MSSRVAINGLGRIGRAILKGIINEPALELVAINDLADVEDLTYLLRFDTVYGRYPKPVTIEDGQLVVAGRKLRTLACHGLGLGKLPDQDELVALIGSLDLR